MTGMDTTPEYTQQVQDQSGHGKLQDHLESINMANGKLVPLFIFQS